MKKIRSLIFFLAALLAYCTVAYTQQSSSSETWLRIESPTKDFSVEVPEQGMLTFKAETYARIWNFDNGVRLFVHVGKSRNAGDEIKYHVKHAGPNTSPKLYTVGDFMVAQVDLPPKRAFTIGEFFQIGDKQHIYTVRAYATDARKDVLEHVLYSIQIAGKPLLINSKSPQANVTSRSTEDLKTSDTVLDILKRPTDKTLKLEFEKNPVFPASDKQIYSRELWIVDMPKADGPMSPEQRFALQPFTVRLSVLFKGDGQIGAVKLLHGVTDFMNYSSFRAAVSIKFLPAEINGKPTDVTREVDYTFLAGETFSSIVDN